MNVICVKCKGRDPSNCGRTFCPITAKVNSMYKARDRLSTDHFFGESPSPFVGRFGYPYVNVGVLTPPDPEDEAWLYDAPREWALRGFDILKVMDLRTALINSRALADVRMAKRSVEVSQLVGMSSKPVDVEVELTKKPHLAVSYSDASAPTGATAQLKRIQMISNPKVSPKVERVVDDTDLKAASAVTSLYEKGFDENFLSRMLSVGTVGVKVQRRFVPTRWSITATDDMIGRHLITKVRDLPEGDTHFVRFGGYLGNYYLLLYFPDVWSYELFETYLPRASWNPTGEIQFVTDREGYNGRKDYAADTAGGYYAARLAILEDLVKAKKQHTIIALRFITGEYAVPLGVWVVREATRKAVAAAPATFSSRELMIQYVMDFAKKKFGADISGMVESSILLRNIRTQKKLRSYF